MEFITEKEGYTALALSIVIRAVEDYKRALINNDSVEIQQIERFFRSKWYATLCPQYKGNDVIRKIKSMVEMRSEENV